MSTPTGGSQLWTASSMGSPAQSRQQEQPKQSPAKAVAGALKRLFRIPTSDKALPEHVPPSPPASPKPAVSPPRKPLDHPKPASFKHQGSFEPGSVLDYDDRFSLATDRTSAVTGTERASIVTDRTSIITDRMSIATDRNTGPITMDRSSSLGDRTAGLSRQSSASRNSGSSRLGTYIRSLIKQPSNVSQATSPTGAGPSSSSPQAMQPLHHHHHAPQPEPRMPTSPTVHSPSAPAAGPPRNVGFALGTPGIGNISPIPPYRSPPGGSGPSTPAPAQTTSPRQLTENAILLPPSPAAIARMQRDPNLLTVCNDLPPAMDRAAWRVEDYTLLQKIHAGYASAVYKAYCRLSGQTVALKVYQPAKLHEISQFQLYREARLHTQMAHPNIIKLYAAFRNGDAVILVQEYADGGDLLQLLMQHGTRLSERRATQLVLQPLLRALYYLHSRFITHRDVKLENILFMGREMTLKLADFGLCLNLREERSVTRAGTLDYMAPEVLRCPQKHKPQDNKDRLDLAYTMTVDIWATGVVAYELLNGCPPFTCHDKKETEKRITSGLMPEFVVDVSDAARDFVYSCLASNADLRPTAWQLLRYSWIKAGTRNSTSVLMDAMAARRVAAGSPASVAPLADVHIGEAHGDDEEEAVKLNAPPSGRAAPGPSTLLPHTSLPSSSTVHPLPQYQTQQMSQVQQTPQQHVPANEPAPSRVLTTNVIAGATRVGTPAQRTTALSPPPIDVYGAGSRLQAPGDTGDLSPQHAPVHRPFLPTGNLGGSGPLLPSSKSSQPLLSTSALLQQMPNSGFASPLGTGQARVVGPGTSSISTRTSAPSPKQASSWQSAGSSTHDQHDGSGPSSGLSPIATRGSGGARGLGKSPSPTRPGPASPQVPDTNVPLPAHEQIAGQQLMLLPLPNLPVRCKQHALLPTKKQLHQNHQQQPAQTQQPVPRCASTISPACTVTQPVTSSASSNPVHNSWQAAIIRTAAATVAAGPPQASHNSHTHANTSFSTMEPLLPSGYASLDSTQRHPGQIIPNLDRPVQSLGQVVRGSLDTTRIRRAILDSQSPGRRSLSSQQSLGSHSLGSTLDTRGSVRSGTSDHNKAGPEGEQRVSDVLRQAFRTVGLSRRPKLPRWDGLSNAWLEAGGAEGSEDGEDSSPHNPSLRRGRAAGRRGASALGEVTIHAASRSAQLVAVLLHERASVRARGSSVARRASDGVDGVGAGAPHTMDSPAVESQEEAGEEHEEEQRVMMRASAPQLIMLPPRNSKLERVLPERVPEDVALDTDGLERGGEVNF